MNQPQTHQIQHTPVPTEPRINPTSARIPTFGANPNENIDSWIFSVKSYFAATSIPQDKYVAIATTHLVGNALAWWQATLCTMKPENRMGLNEFIFPSWQDFEKEITTRFRRAFDVPKLYEELKSLRQVGTVEEYNTKFSQIEIRLPKLDQEAKMCLYIAGLGTKVSNHVVAKEPCSLQEAMKMAAVFGEKRFQVSTEAYQPVDMMNLGH